MQRPAVPASAVAPSHRPATRCRATSPNHQRHPRAITSMQCLLQNLPVPNTTSDFPSSSIHLGTHHPCSLIRTAARLRIQQTPLINLRNSRNLAKSSALSRNQETRKWSAGICKAKVRQLPRAQAVRQKEPRKPDIRPNGERRDIISFIQSSSL